MFGGIIKDTLPIADVQETKDGKRFWIQSSSYLTDGLELGASVALDGVCLTVVEETHEHVSFDAIPETLRVTTLGERNVGDVINIERSIRVGDEIGGHLLSGHIKGMGEIIEIDESEGYVVWIQFPTDLTKYFFEKGFIAIDGISLTVVDVDKEQGKFSVHLIPETRERTGLGKKKAGERVNLEIDSTTQMIVETVERMTG